MRSTPSSPGHDIGRSELAREFLSRGMPAHGDDPARAHLLRRENAEQAHRTIANNRHGHAGLHVGGIRGKPAGAQHVGSR
jgi:hypothetical protein